MPRALSSLLRSPRLIAALAAGAFVAGCGSSPMSPPPPSARLELVNLAPHPWQIWLRREGDTTAGERVVIPARGARTLAVAAGAYRLRQRFDGPVQPLEREVAASFEVGQHYHWPLTTLLSPPEAGAAEGSPIRAP